MPDPAPMKPLTKVSIVLAAYILALVIATTVVAVYVKATSGPDRQTYGAMYDFGDSLLFLAVFGVAALPGTGAALFFLRPYRPFWRVLVCVVPVTAVTGILALVDYLLPREPTAATFLGSWSGLSPLRFFAAPLFAVAFLVATLFAPTRFYRIAFFAATVVETVVFLWIALLWSQAPQ